MRASMQVRTRYFLAGGKARWPLVKPELYFSEAASTFVWMTDMFGVVCGFNEWVGCVWMGMWMGKATLYLQQKRGRGRRSVR